MREQDYPTPERIRAAADALASPQSYDAIAAPVAHLSTRITRVMATRPPTNDCQSAQEPLGVRARQVVGAYLGSTAGDVSGATWHAAGAMVATQFDGATTVLDAQVITPASATTVPAILTFGVADGAATPATTGLRSARLRAMDADSVDVDSAPDAATYSPQRYAWLAREVGAWQCGAADTLDITQAGLLALALPVLATGATPAQAAPRRATVTAQVGALSAEYPADAAMLVSLRATSYAADTE
jgi:hypothetical protein